VDVVHHEQMEAAVVVIIQPGGDGPAAAGNAGLSGDVAELQRAQIPEEPVEVARRFFPEGGDAGPVSEEDVGEPVAVIVEGGHAARHGLDVALLLGVVVLQDEAQADALGRLHKPDSGAQPRCAQGESCPHGFSQL
jgi:hypothetical protein